MISVRLRQVAVALAFSLAAAAGSAAPVGPGSANPPDIPFQKFVLPNGLTVVFHEDHKAPIVAVNVWYHVGSKNEKRGKTGFAHLFEHLMFNGSEHFNDDYFKAMEKVGATDMNGTTNTDRTNYFQNVPTSAFDLALFMESDRMGHLLGAVDQKRLDEQRGVVQNEKRQGENQPYGVARQLLTENTYPVGHPYSWTVIGSMEDLGAASLDDAREWFKASYGPNNAVLAIAGDVTLPEVKAKVEKYFGDIPPGPPMSRQVGWIAKMTGTHRQVVQDRVPQARLYMVWNVPGWGSPEATWLDLATDVLSSGKSSRLYKRLVYDDQIATSVAAYISEREIGGQVTIQADVKPGGDLAAVEKAVREELERLMKDGPTADELGRAKMQYRAGFIRGAERIGGFGGKSDILASNAVYGGDPGFYKTRLAREDAATAGQVRKAALDWMSDGVYVLEVHPFPQLAAPGAAADRSKLPEVTTPPVPKFASCESRVLPNGLNLVVARRDSVPVVDFHLLVDAGFAADQGGVPGTASLAMATLDEGTRTRTALEISDALDRLGASLGTGSDVDSSYLTLSALKETLDPALDILADVALNPSFPEADFERVRKQQLARIRREKVSPNQMAMRVLPVLLYGKGHAYAQPLTGSGTEASVSSLTREQLARFHQTWFQPGSATLVVTGAVSMAEIAPKIERVFAGWKAGKAPAKTLATVADRPRPEVYIIDRPGSQQSAIFAGHLAPPKNNPEERAIETVNEVFGGAFVSRINMNLREDKHWSYGAGSFFRDARGQRPFLVYSSVQADKTKESLQEVVKELHGIAGGTPVTAEELAMAQSDLTLSLPGRWETNAAVAGSLAEILTFGLPRDYFDTYATAVRGLTLANVNAVAKKIFRPDNAVYVVVGDRGKIEAGIRELNLGDLRLIDADGQPVQAPPVP